IGAAVGHHAYLAGGLLLPSPSAHHKRIVNRDAPDFIHSLGLECIEVTHITWHMLGRTGRGESPGQAEDRDLFAFNHVFHFKVFWSPVPASPSTSMNSFNVPLGKRSPTLIAMIYLLIFLVVRKPYRRLNTLSRACAA